MADIEDVINPVAQPAFGTNPYGDGQEVTGPPTVTPIQSPYREFFFTDARSILIRLVPHHMNFFRNPSFRVNTAGWEGTGTAVPAGSDVELSVGTAEENYQALTDLAPLVEEGTLVQFFDDPARPVLVRDDASTLDPAESPEPLSASVPGWRLANLDDALDSGDSWVGQSLYINGDLTLRYRDLDINSAPQYVYVGPDETNQGDDWWVRGAPSSQWTFTAFFKGAAEIRMVLEGYAPQDPDVVRSPPGDAGLPQVQTGAGVDYDSGIPKVVDDNGIVWELGPGPFYERLLQMVEVDPLTLDHQTDPFVITTTGEVYQAIHPRPASAPYYIQLSPPPATVPYSPSPTTLTPEDVNEAFLVTRDETDNDKKNILYRNTGAAHYLSTNATAPTASVYGQWTQINTEDWRRMILQTGVRTSDLAELFFQCTWLDARIEVRNADGLRISSLQLDPTEHPIAPYFDGDMTEEPGQDDFLWSGEPNDSVSEYYRQRSARTQWLWRSLPHVVPAARPVQLYYMHYSRPYIPPDAAYGNSTAARSSGGFVV